MACCGLSRGVALVAGTRVGTVPASSSPRLPHARVRLPALPTARSLAMRCHRGRDDTGAPTSIDFYQHPRTASSSQHQQHLPRDADTYERHQDPSSTIHGTSTCIRGRHEEAAAALAGAVADAFRPLLDNLNQLRSLRTVFDIEDYHIGMPFGALLACVGLFQVWKVDPSTCLDIALTYAFYKLSVVASGLRKRGFSNDIITRIQLAIAVTMAFKDVHKKFVPLDYIRFPVFILYTVSVLWDLAGVKKDVKFAFMELMHSSSLEDQRRETCYPYSTPRR